MNNARIKLIEAITAPLGFFVLALLIVECFLANVLIFGNLERSEKVLGMYLGVVLFVLVVAAVFILSWCKPQSLTFDKSAHLIDRGKAPFGTDSHIVKDRELLPTTSKNKK